MSLQDPHLCDALKVQVQIIGAFQVQDTFVATLQYQLAYKLQNHAFDMAVPDIAQVRVLNYWKHERLSGVIKGEGFKE